MVVEAGAGRAQRALLVAMELDIGQLILTFVSQTRTAPFFQDTDLTTKLDLILNHIFSLQWLKTSTLQN